MDTYDRPDFDDRPALLLDLAVAASAKLPLPLPRLQLTWLAVGDRKWRCRYDLLVPVGRYDRRNEGNRGFAAATYGETEAEGYGPTLGATVNTPVGDGSHAAWDSARLRIPAYAVHGDRFTFIAPSLSCDDREDPRDDAA